VKLALIGHASWLVDTPDTRILFDPLLFDPNQADCYEVHPSRRVHLTELADVDVVVVSHRHIDHFDVRSLCSLAKTATVLSPRDPLIVKALETIGFAKVRVIEDWDRVHCRGTTIVATPSRNPVPEHGFVVSDGRHTIWNQVDTQVAPETATEVNRVYGRLDVLIAPWQPLLELKFQLNESTSFPHQAYADLIRQACGCATKVLIPGANGFRYGRRSRWLNRIAFPVARDRFAEDVRRALPPEDTAIHQVNPGDEIVCHGDAPEIGRQTATVASSASGEEGLVAFCPVDPFQDLFRDRVSLTTAECGVSSIIDDLDRFIQRELANGSSPLCAYGQWKVRYQLIVCFEAGNLFVNWDFAHGARRVDGRNLGATATSIIDGRILQALASGACSWEEAYHSGGWRFFQSVAVVSPTDYVVPPAEAVVDIVQLRYPYAESLDMLIATELERWTEPGRRTGG
jgi:hypothetical protein